MVKYIIKPGLDKIHFQDGKMLGQWATYCCKEKKKNKKKEYNDNNFINFKFTAHGFY